MPEIATFKLLAAARSDPGRDPNKQVNEDAFRLYESRDGLLVVVCDGMGGHIGGKLASNAAVNSIERNWRARGPGTDPQRLLGQCIQQAAAEVYELGGNSAATERPGTTCVAAWLSSRGLYLAHVGDSRAYRLRSGALYPLTVDHTVVEAWIAAGQITREQAKGHPDAHRITRALGISPQVEVELRPLEDLRPQDRFLFCSDGLTDLVSNEEMSQWLASPNSLDAIADSLVQLANQRGGHDNITVVLVEVEAPAATVVDSTQTATVLGQSVPFPKTVAIDAVGQPTVLMGAPTVPQQGTVEMTPAKDRPEKTVPLRQAEVVAAPLPRLPRPSGFPEHGNVPQHKGQRQLWLALGIGVLLSVLAILVRLLRHRSG